MSSRGNGRRAELVALIGSLVIANAAAAQDTPKADSGELAEITVTARYTKENLQETPLAVTAVSGAQLEARNIVSTADLGAIIPNLYTHPGDQEEGPTPTISMGAVLCRMEDAHRRSSHGKAGSGEGGVGVGGRRLELEAKAR